MHEHLFFNWMSKVSPENWIGCPSNVLELSISMCLLLRDLDNLAVRRRTCKIPAIWKEIERPSIEIFVQKILRHLWFFALCVQVIIKSFIIFVTTYKVGNYTSQCKGTWVNKWSKARARETSHLTYFPAQTWVMHRSRQQHRVFFTFVKFLKHATNVQRWEILMLDRKWEAGLSV